VITQANTFIATALAITSAGATPVLVDVDPVTYNIDTTALAAAVTSRTKAIMPVHLYGQIANMDRVCEVARSHGLLVIEDACQAHGARYRGQRAGSFGDAAAFSFYPSKNLGAYGDGGIVVARDPSVLDRLRMLRNYGQREKYIHEVAGFNRRLDTIQAAALRVKLQRLDDWNAARRGHAARYADGLTALGITPPSAGDEMEPVWHLYVIEVDGRDELRTYLAERSIEAGIHYPLPIHLQPAYAHLGLREGAFPVTEAAAKRILSLPMYPELPAESLDAVLEALAVWPRARDAALTRQ
jgi:dTDP-4-amino-4,6-dideoxygalactose transaminase